MLEVKDLYGGYGKITILNGVSFAIPRGSITTVIGPNGAGKSTVFKAIFGLLNIHSGQVLLEGRDVTGSKPRDMIAHGVTYVPQGRNVVPQLSVYHNLELGGITAQDQDRVKARIEVVMDQFPMLREFRDRKAIELSGGQQKQLEVARALMAQLGYDLDAGEFTRRFDARANATNSCSSDCPRVANANAVLASS